MMLMDIMVRAEHMELGDSFNLEGDELKDFPCPYFGMIACSETCFQECGIGDIYRAHIKLRADHAKLREAVLGRMPTGLAREIYQRTEQVCEQNALYMATERVHAIIEWLDGLAA